MEQPTIPQQSPNIPSTRSHKTLFFSLATLLTALLIILAVIIISVPKNQKQSSNTKTPAPTVTSQTSQTSIPTGSQKSATLYELNGSTLTVLTKLTTMENPSFSPAKPTFDQAHGDVYFVSATGISKYNLTTKTSTSLLALPKIPKSTPSSLSYLPPHFLYITQTADDYYGVKQSQTVQEVNLETKTVRMIGPLAPTMYGGMDYLYTSPAGDIVGSFGGDSCGGWGEISAIKDNKMHSVAETGSGCSEKPRYVGVFPDRDELLLASVSATDKTDEIGGTVYAITQLYTQQASSSAKELFFNTTSLKETITDALMNQNQKTIALIGESSVYIIDSKTKLLLKSIPGGKVNGYINAFSENKIHYTTYGNGDNDYINITNGQKTTVNWLEQIGSNLPVTILGEWQGRTIFVNVE